MKLLIGIPAYNEAKVIRKVLKSLPKKIHGIRQIDILVVDDGSGDNTSEIAGTTGVMIVKHILNRGLGGALKTIFAYASMRNYDILVTFDADGQHDPNDISKLVKEVINGKDVVIGSRWFSSSKVPYSRLVVNQLANIITFLFFGIWSSDTQSGFRAFGREAIRNINLRTDGMEVSSEIFREIRRIKLKYSEVPIRVIYTDYSLSKGQRISNAPNVFFNLLLRLLE